MPAGGSTIMQMSPRHRKLLYIYIYIYKQIAKAMGIIWSCLKHAGTTPGQYNRQRRRHSRDVVLRKTVVQ